MHKYVYRILQFFIPTAFVITALFATVYGAVQQVLRQSANDPQVQMAEDISSALTSGQQPTTFTQSGPVDVARSLSSYVIIYSDDGAVVSSTAQLDGNSPSIPRGVLEYARTYGEDRVTWQPRAGVRQAIVAIRYGGAQPGYVVVGRSLREIEIRSTKIMYEILVAWAGTLIGALLFVFLGVGLGYASHVDRPSAL